MRTQRTCLFGASRSVALALLLLALTGCASMYVDNAVGEPDPARVRIPTQPEPTQLIFSFQTKGTPNAKAAEFLREDAKAAVESLGIFQAVSYEPVPSRDVLSITINNVVADDAAFAKGFATGLTFGLAGNVVTDGYICTIDYLPGGGGPKIEKVAHHAIHTTLGAHSAPPNATKAKDASAAVKTVTRQVIGKALTDLAADPAFGR